MEQTLVGGKKYHNLVNQFMQNVNDSDLAHSISFFWSHICEQSEHVTTQFKICTELGPETETNAVVQFY
jgi:hypothetical protein